ncbi:hypothetical protein NE398_20135 [Clostridium tertium]|uniref:Uncharacterized protein n=1 Tax=Clostridium tertium TaxID=1559 RepID=A0A9X3XQS4_9CLOT|nr:hypothetical protein [Clostridium tertium]MDC4242444.1 hypothetical protein [Clostridium tertium]
MYPDSIDKFIEKLNKIENNTYVIEEEVTLKDGVYEGYLEHDNVSVSSINVYSGKKLTGEKIDNFILSTPSKTPWKNIIKIMAADYQVLYITYETQGDTVEADDINILQESIVKTQREVDRYKYENDTEVNKLKEKTKELENIKADKTYVDIELNKKYNKSEVYTKSETDSRIKEVVGAAPEALDTLKEIADSLNNDADFAGTMTKQLSHKVDKVEGKQLSTEDYTTLEKNKLAGIEERANNYIHPSTHNASIITEDTNHRFITDTERTNWNDANSKKHTHSNKSILDTITQIIIDKWNSAVDHIADTIKHITKEERTLWNTVSNKVDKVTGKGLSTNDFTSTYKSKLDNLSKNDVGLGNLTNDSQVKRSEMGVASGVATLDSKGVNLQAPKAHTHDDRYYTETEANNKFVTKDELGDAGYGDMTKSVYDTNNNGIVDKAESVEWNGILNKPSTFQPSSHEHTKAQITDFPTKLSQFSNDNEYMLNLKNQTNTTIVNSNIYKIPYQCTVSGTTATDMGLTSGWWHIHFFAHQAGNGYGCQVAYPLNQPSEVPRYRTSQGTDWDSWRKIRVAGAAMTWNDLKGV